MRSPRHVAVTSDQSLVADTVSAALAAPDLTVTRLAWSGEVLAGPRRPEGGRFDVGVLLTELRPLARLAEATRIMRDVPAPWLVLTVVRKGPLWGALLEGGAAAVLRSACTLGELREAIDLVADGQELMSGQEALGLRASWQGVAVERTRVARNLRSLSPREAEVLALMHSGESVRGIARRFGVSEATVRSHVRAVLRKLRVRSQLEAVAAYQLTNDWQPGD